MQYSVKQPNLVLTSTQKNDFTYWFRVVRPFTFEYIVTLLCGLLAIVPGMCLLLLVTFGISQLQGQPRLVSWPELLGEHASRWLLPVVRNGPFEAGLSVEHQRWFIAPALLFVGLLANCLRAIQEYRLENLGEKITKNLRNDLTSSYLSADYMTASSTQGALLASFYGDDSREIRQCFTRLCGSIPTEAFNSFFYLMLLLLLDTQLFVLFFAIFVPAGLIVRATGSYLKKLAKTGIRIQTELSQSFLEKMKGWQSIQSFRSQNFEADRFEETNSAIFHVWRRSARAKALSSPTVEWLGITAGAFVLILALRRVYEGALPSTILTAFLVTVAQLSGSLQTAVNQFNSTKKGSAALQRIVDFIDHHIRFSNHQEQELQATRDLLDNETNQIKIKTQELALEHPEHDGKFLFKDITLTLSNGDSLAIVGPSGSGKSSFLECISGLRAPTLGKILVERNERQSIANQSLARTLRVAYLTQDPFFFAGTIGENVCYPEIFDPSDKNQIHSIEQALKNACLSNPLITASVQSLSGGEKQRLAFARGFYAKPDVWLIDEGTSALDSTTEADLLLNLKNQTQNAVKIFVAHRTSMQNFATQTIVVGNSSMERTS